MHTLTPAISGEKGAELPISVKVSRNLLNGTPPLSHVVWAKLGGEFSYDPRKPVAAHTPGSGFQ